MPRLPRRLLLCPLFAAAVALAVAAPAPSQDDNKSKSLTFKSHDDVTLQGVLHRSAKGPNSPCVILLHQYGVDPNKGGFKKLADELTAKGFHVLRFDFRGHGQSTLVNPNRFWTDSINAAYMPSLAKKRPPADKLPDLTNPQQAVKVRAGYFPRLADDVMAARVTLDQLNDNSEVNTSSVYLIGAGDAVDLGFLYIAAEWSRTQKMPPLYTQYPALTPRRGGMLGSGDNPAGLDVAGAVWLSPARNRAVTTKDLQNWVQYAPEMRERTPMLFIHGEKDTAAAAESRVLRDQVLAAKVAGAPLPALKLTEIRAIKNAKLAGAQLLGEGLETEKLIVDYLDALEKERKNLIRIANRGFSTPPPINLRMFGVLELR